MVYGSLPPSKNWEYLRRFYIVLKGSVWFNCMRGFIPINYLINWLGVKPPPKIYFM